MKIVLGTTMHAMGKVEDAILIDIGSNIGLYSLTAVSMGHSNFAFEPFRPNFESIC
jgi:hypothetical protein